MNFPMNSPFSLISARPRSLSNEALVGAPDSWRSRTPRRPVLPSARFLPARLRAAPAAGLRPSPRCFVRRPEAAWCSRSAPWFSARRGGAVLGAGLERSYGAPLAMEKAAQQPACCGASDGQTERLVAAVITAQAPENAGFRRRLTSRDVRMGRRGEFPMVDAPPPVGKQPGVSRRRDLRESRPLRTIL